MTQRWDRDRDRDRVRVRVRVIVILWAGRDRETWRKEELEGKSQDGRIWNFRKIWGWRNGN